ncbi:MAG: Eco57I restriction-modification methylase domain-containing protein [Kiritimatiellae bacterium]|nr:Eco57I restriction-modification methylase domain-containing protein [Kiritimatiellia bacterium]
MAEQIRIDGGKSIEARRAMGQFATPPALAREIARATVPFLDGTGPLDMLEPSAGTGAFLSAFFGEPECRVGRATAIELDPEFFASGKRLWAGRPCDYRNADFTKEVPDRGYDLVVANPPYVRHHGIAPDDKRRLQAAVLGETGQALSGLAGLYCHFLMLSLKWMKPGGVGVWLIPAEWMSVNYGSAVRAFLSSRVRLLRVHRFAADDVRFADALVSSCVVWFRNAQPAENALFTEGGDLLRPASSREISVAALRATPKWPPAPGQEDAADNVPRLRDFFAIRRGIATGDNAFFILDERNAAERGIPRALLKPILPSPRHLETDCIQSDGDGVPTNARRLFLLDCTGKALGELPEAVRDYLATGTETTAKKKLCAARTHWYDQEQRRPAPILCSYMGRGDGTGAPVRFILNESDAIATNSFLMLYPTGALARRLGQHPQEATEVWRRLRAIPALEFRRAGRCYGGGLQKMEPKELGDLAATALRDWLADIADYRYPETETGQLLFAMEPPPEPWPVGEASVCHA